jgi:hypothetical protein
MHRRLFGREGQISRHAYGVGVQKHEQQQNQSNITGSKFELDAVSNTDTLDISL